MYATVGLRACHWGGELWPFACKAHNCHEPCQSIPNYWPEYADGVLVFSYAEPLCNINLRTSCQRLIAAPILSGSLYLCLCTAGSAGSRSSHASISDRHHGFWPRNGSPADGCSMAPDFAKNQGTTLLCSKLMILLFNIGPSLMLPR